MQSALKAVAGRLSYIREIDVLQDQLRSFLKNNKGLSGRKALAGLLKNERKKEETALRGYLSDDSLGIIVNGITSWIRQRDMDPARFELFALQRYSKWNRNLAEALNALDDDDHARMHSLRIRLKKLHNVQDNVRLPLESTWMDLSRLKLFQHDLGEICDTYAGILILRQLDTTFEVKGLSMETRVFTEHLLSLRQELTGRFLRKKAQISGTLALPGGSHETE
jgi:CHAD domain-containing protein